MTEAKGPKSQNEIRALIDKVLNQINTIIVNKSDQTPQADLSKEVGILEKRQNLKRLAENANLSKNEADRAESRAIEVIQNNNRIWKGESVESIDKQIKRVRAEIVELKAPVYNNQEGGKTTTEEQIELSLAGAKWKLACTKSSWVVKNAHQYAT